MGDTITAPWTDEQVEALNKHQSCGMLHPYTCSNRGDGNHQWRNGDLGTLVATKDGWICPDCDYAQDWAHDPGGIMQHVENLLAYFENARRGHA